MLYFVLFIYLSIYLFLYYCIFPRDKLHKPGKWQRSSHLKKKKRERILDVAFLANYKPVLNFSFLTKFVEEVAF